MRMLAYDTSSDILSMALFEGSKICAEFQSPLYTRHSSVLAPMIDKLLRRSKWQAATLGCVAVGLGPGSFTGLRVGVTTAKVLCYASGAKLVGVSSLEIRAMHAKTAPQEIAVMLDARKGNVYAALYKKNERGLPQVVREPALMEQADFLKMASASAVFIKEDVFPSAADLGRIALERIRQNKFMDPFKAEPSYLHPKDCNVILKGSK